MKYIKLFFVIISIGSFSSAVQAQDNIVKFRPVGVWVQTLKKVDYGYGKIKRNFSDYNIGFTYERVLAENLSAALDFDIVFAGNALFVLRPNVNVYILDAAPQSLYIGGYFDAGFGNWNGWTHIGLGPKVGYQHLFLDNQLAVSGEFGLGFGMFTDAALDGSGPGAGVNTFFTVGAGYAF